jgi:predicted amidohydrolase
MSQQIFIAGVQMEPKIFEKENNLERIINLSREAHKKGARLVVFPECALTGYIFFNLQEAQPMAEAIPGPSTDRIQKICKELDFLVLVGLIEKEGNECFNSAVLIGGEGVIGKYRKIHLPFLGLDRFVKRGDIPFKVYDTKLGKLGWVICYDQSFPETIRILAIKGAEIVALLTNWPEGVEATSRYIVPARAVENRINYIAVNRVGRERGFRFIGESKIIDYSGKILAEASSDREEILYAEVDLEKAREKRQVFIPGELELDRLKDRRPEFYYPLIDPNF